MEIQKYLTEKSIIKLRNKTKDAILKALVNRASEQIGDYTKTELLEKVIGREKLANTSIGKGIAIPHARIKMEKNAVVIMARLPKGVEYFGADQMPVKIIILVLVNEEEPELHLTLLSEISQIFKEEKIRNEVLEAKTSRKIRFLLFGKMTAKKKTEKPGDLTSTIITHARAIARKEKINTVFLYADALKDSEIIRKFTPMKRLVIVTSSSHKFTNFKKSVKSIIQVPPFGRKRTGQIEPAILFALSRGIVNVGDKVLSLTGIIDSGDLDTMLVNTIGAEYRKKNRINSNLLPPDAPPEILERAIFIAERISLEGREGKPVGSMLILGDTEKVLQYCKQLVINPFKGYKEEERNILDPLLEETIKEFSTIDGAFIIDHKGTIISAGTYINPPPSTLEIPKGLGARHEAAAGLSESTEAIAIVVSESTGNISIFKNGEILLTITKNEK